MKPGFGQRLIAVGLLYFPNLLEENVQVTFLEKLIHRDLSNPKHNTNLHFHHVLPYDSSVPDQTGKAQASFFGLGSSVQLRPIDPSQHKPLTVNQMLKRKLRWVTLGGQYDWTRKTYPEENPPTFPADIHRMLSKYFPDVDAQAAIVNFYSPGDTLSVHRDVSEDCAKDLISISIGCDGLFLIASEDTSQIAILRLRSGDAVLMSGESRFAWHGVPKVLPETCPTSLAAWPYLPGGSQYHEWKGWLGSKRININVRQMRETPF